MPADAKTRAVVHVTWKLDGKTVAKCDQTRNVWQRKTGGFYIISLGFREPVRRLKDGTFSQVYNGTSVRDRTGNLLGIATD